MTVSNPTITFDNTSTATFRAWGSAVSSALQTVGLVKTTDTGQIDFTTVAVPGANTAAGYEIYRLSDSLQASKPVFMKVEYGSGPAGSYPAIWITFSNATNGAGTLTGLLTNTRKIHYGAGSGASPQPCYFAGDGSYLTMLLAPALFGSNGSGYFCMLLAFDRTRDVSNAITSDGFHFTSTHSRAVSSPSTYGAPLYGNLNFGVITMFSAGVFSFKISAIGQVGDTGGTGVSYLGNLLFQIPLGLGTTTYLGDVYYFPQLITAPAISYSSLLMVGFNTDLPAGLTTLTVPNLGATRTYIVVNLDFTGLGTSVIRTLVRYE